MDIHIFTRVLTGLLGLCLFLAFSFFCLTSVHENERRAARIALVLALVTPLPFGIIAIFYPNPLFLALLLALATMGVLATILPIGQPKPETITAKVRIDERDIMFARYRLIHGTPEYRDYYTRHPEKQMVDDRIRAAPGLFQPNARLYHPWIIPASDASFSTIVALHEAVDGLVAEQKVECTPADISTFIKHLAKTYGAANVGITGLKKTHIYSHIGRGPGTYGEPIALDHRYAIAITVAMDHALMRTAPEAPETVTVTQGYLSAATIAIQLGFFIRSLGYPARAHIDGNYQVVCPLVARDAGLGEIGRMGILMTPQHGPRVRIGVVTTDLLLVPDPPKYDPTVIDFCRRCHKCADNCPSHSISFGDRPLIDGVRRWQINSEQCYHYWSVTGTDCGRCIAVCPYSHPSNLAHAPVRWAIQRSPIARQGAQLMDDLFYGRHPQPAPWPRWME